MKIATFNVNDINKRLANLLTWLAEAQPDIVCLQELKADRSRFPEATLYEAGYASAWQGQRSWNGVAILAKGSTPIVTRTTLPGDDGDAQARYIEAAVSGILVASIYLPNGNPRPGPKFDYKLAWFERLIAHAGALLAEGVPVVLAGDYNVVPADLDIYSTTSWDEDALLALESRAAFTRLMDQGWTDALRTIYPEERVYTFWSNRRGRWGRDAGLRLDHLLLSPAIAGRLSGAGVDRDVRGEEGASDHAPAWMTIFDPAAQAARPSRPKLRRPAAADVGNRRGRA